MDARDIAEELYRSFKSQVLWKEIDFKRIAKFEKIIKKRFAIVLKETIDKHEALSVVATEPMLEDNATVVSYDTPETKKTTKEVIDEIIDGEEPDEELIVMEPGEPMTLLQRVTMDQDNQIVQDILKEAEDKLEEKTKDLSPEEKAKVFEDVASGAIKKRFKVDIVCNNIIKKPNFQIFKGQDMIETNFRTDEVTSHKKVFFAYIDTNNEQNIRETIPEYFSAASVKIEPADIDVIPIQYQQIWQNRTNL